MSEPAGLGLKAGVIVLSPPQVSPKPLSTVLPGKKTALEAVLLEALLNLVDRYWSGYKSLHSNETFLGELGQWGTTHLWHKAGSVPCLAGPSSLAIAIPAVLQEVSWPSSPQPPQTLLRRGGAGGPRVLWLWVWAPGEACCLGLLARLLSGSVFTWEF